MFFIKNGNEELENFHKNASGIQMKVILNAKALKSSERSIVYLTAPNSRLNLNLISQVVSIGKSFHSRGLSSFVSLMQPSHHCPFVYIRKWIIYEFNGITSRFLFRLITLETRVNCENVHTLINNNFFSRHRKLVFAR